VDEPTVCFGFDGCFSEVITGSDSHIGTREYQQDALYVTETAIGDPTVPLKAFGVLCDGMGGLEDGEKASRIAVENLAAALGGFACDSEVDRFFVDEIHRLDGIVRAECGERGEGGEAGGDTAYANGGAGAGGAGQGRNPNDPVEDGAPNAAGSSDRKTGAPKSGTTLTAALIYGDRLHWASVGDSRIYILRGGDIVQVSRDHNYSMLLREYVRQGRMEADDAESHPMRGALVSFIGSGNVRYIDTNRTPFALESGDIVLLCSDGLVKSLADEEIQDVVNAGYGDMASAAKSLTLAAFDKGSGSKDNISVILMQYFI
jgi:protein phosphatase